MRAETGSARPSGEASDLCVEGRIKGAHDFGEAGEDHGFHVGGDPGAGGVDEGDVGCDRAHFAQGYASAVRREVLGGRFTRRV